MRKSKPGSTKGRQRLAKLPPESQTFVARETKRREAETKAHVDEMLMLRSDQTDSVSVDLHQQRLNWDGRLLSFGHTCGRLRSQKLKAAIQGS